MRSMRAQDSLPPELFQAGGDSELRAGPAGDEGGGAASGAGGVLGAQGVAAPPRAGCTLTAVVRA